MQYKSGVLLVNLGTPAAPEAKAIRPFLHRFLSDQRVINLPAWLWQPVLHTAILPWRPQRVAKNYQKIWSKEYGSPLTHYTNLQVQRLQAKLPNTLVKAAYSYSEPLIDTVLAEFVEANVEQLTVIPLYPQYSTTTVAAVTDAVHRFFIGQTRVPTLKLVTEFWQHDGYLTAVANQIMHQWRAQDYDDLVISYHGLPEKIIAAGDPYAKQCAATTARLLERLPLAAEQVHHTYQSRFGGGKWLTPATDATLAKLAQAHRNVLVVAPAFVTDCLETSYELGIENAAAFSQAGGGAYSVVPSLNAAPEFINCLAELA